MPAAAFSSASEDDSRQSDEQFQHAMLPRVSRTFALTIPQLPPPLDASVANAYLLCRIADAIEDDPGLTPSSKRDLHIGLVDVLDRRADGDAFSRRAAAALSERTPADERDLVRQTARVARVTHRFTPVQVDAIRTCVAKMCRGMPEFQHVEKARGLSDVVELDRYCYYVAGVVGEMLTSLFCDYSPEIADRREEMQMLAASFGQGLQMTNILKDVWEDRRAGSCWLPRDLFASAGYDLTELDPVKNREAFNAAHRDLIAIAHGHLRNALNYTLFIPKKESGIRRFCLWAIGLAVLTLQRIRRNPDYASGDEVKVPRLAVASTIATTNLFIRHNLPMRMLFELTAHHLPLKPVHFDYLSELRDVEHPS